ncbi:MAG TPA: hypothetical protein VG273_16030 [Bryobacteraceae bacterium]|jgi:hypothetical protein|nr:hypothetical protein [Bryobacteraceae bacterium]
MISPDAIQHINVKIFITDAAAIEPGDAVGVFHRWIRDNIGPELLIDVAEYGHVPAGPGVLLIGHEANYSLDNRENRLGLLYNRKVVLEGGFRSRLGQAHQAALTACDRLEQEEPFRGKLKFDRNAIEVFVNDRLLAPNTDETWEALRPELESYFGACSIERRGEPRDLFRVAVTKL